MRPNTLLLAAACGGVAVIPDLAGNWEVGIRNARPGAIVIWLEATRQNILAGDTAAKTPIALTPSQIKTLPVDLATLNIMMSVSTLASAVSWVAGATTVSASPAANDVGLAIVNVAVVAGDAANTIVPTVLPFFLMLNVAAELAAVPA
jgi:hypothetical protein